MKHEIKLKPFWWFLKNIHFFSLRNVYLILIAFVWILNLTLNFHNYVVNSNVSHWYCVIIDIFLYCTVKNFNINFKRLIKNSFPNKQQLFYYSKVNIEFLSCGCNKTSYYGCSPWDQRNHYVFEIEKKLVS